LKTKIAPYQSLGAQAHKGHLDHYSEVRKCVRKGPVPRFQRVGSINLQVQKSFLPKVGWKLLLGTKFVEIFFQTIHIESLANIGSHNKGFLKGGE
jgi:hypothetical protein